MMLWAARYLPHAIVAALIAGGAAWSVHKIREGVRNDLEPKIVRLEAELAAERANRKRTEAVLDGYQAELDGLRVRRADVGPVRLCRQSAQKLPAAAQAAGGADGASAAFRSRSEGSRGDSQEGPGPDIGSDLVELAASCDAVAARLRALQQWAAPP